MKGSLHWWQKCHERRIALGATEAGCQNMCQTIPAKLVSLGLLGTYHVTGCAKVSLLHIGSSGRPFVMAVTVVSKNVSSVKECDNDEGGQQPGIEQVA